jgi:hypothetical protein
MVDPMTKEAIFDLRVGEALELAGIVVVEILDKSGKTARVRVTAPRNVLIEKNWSGRGETRANHANLGSA